MRHAMMISVAVLALAAGTGVAGAQQRGPAGASPSAQTAPQATPENPAATSPTTSNPGSRAARDRVIPEKEQKQTQAPPGKGSTGTAQTEPGPRGQQGAQEQKMPHNQQGLEQRGPNDRKGTAERPTDQRQGAAERPNEPKQGTAERPMQSSNVSLSTEQKTTIREKVLTSSAPRISGRVDFDIKVGTVVPRTIRIAPVPPTLVEIEPQWRGYMYFVNGDEIIVIEPNSLRIVAVLEV